MTNKTKKIVFTENFSNRVGCTKCDAPINLHVITITIIQFIVTIVLKKRVFKSATIFFFFPFKFYLHTVMSSQTYILIYLKTPLILFALLTDIYIYIICNSEISQIEHA